MTIKGVAVVVIVTMILVLAFLLKDMAKSK
jgi:hypothetical protein